MSVQMNDGHLPPKGHRHNAVRRRAVAVSTTALLVAGVAAVAVVVRRSDPAPSRSADALPLHDTSSECPPAGKPVTLEYLTSHGLESPQLPSDLAKQAVVKSVTCRGNQDGMTSIDLNISAFDEDFEHYSVIVIGGEATGFDPNEIVDGLELGPTPDGHLDGDKAHADEPYDPEKAGMIRIPVGSWSLLAIDPESRLADVVQLSSPSAAYASIESLRWNNG